MTAIDTSKLKEGMRVEYKINDTPFKSTLTRSTAGRWFDYDNAHCLIDSYGNVSSNVTDLVFPDLQAQDRMEAWKPGDNALGFEDMQLTIIAIHGDEAWCKYSNCGIDKVHSLSMLKPIPKPDTGGELREIVERIIYCESASPARINEFISQIKSLLAAKVPPTYMEIHQYIDKKIAEGSAPKYAGFQAVLHFTKNETK